MLTSLLIISIILVVTFKYIDEILQKIRLILWAWKIPGPLSIPPIGGTYRFMCSRQEILNRVRKIFQDFPQPLIKIWLGPKLFLIVRSPPHLEKILQSNTMIVKDSLMDVAKPYIGEGLITGDGAKWKAHRKLIMPTLSTKNIESFCEVFHKHAAILVEKFEQHVGNEIILEDFLHPCAIDIVCETVMDIEIHAQQSLNPEFMWAAYMMYFVIVERMVKPWLQPEFLLNFSPLMKEHQKTLKILRGFIGDVIQKKRDRKQAEIVKNLIKSKTNNENGDNQSDSDEDNDNSQPIKFKTTIDQLLKASLDNTLEISDKEMIDEMLTIFMASSDPVASISSFCLKMLAMHPDYQERVVNEFQEKLAHHQRPMDTSICSELTFLDRCIKETIRLFPIGPFIVRINNEDFKLDDNITIPKGVSVMMALFDVHRNPKYWKKPDEFYPDHFLPEEVDSRPQFAYVPFSSGLRVCIGKLYAAVSIKIIIVKVLQKFRLNCKADQPTVKDLHLTNDISIRARDGNNIIISYRK